MQGKMKYPIFIQYCVPCRILPWSECGIWYHNSIGFGDSFTTPKTTPIINGNLDKDDN